jgi:hypothetical protein
VKITDEIMDLTMTMQTSDDGASGETVDLSVSDDDEGELLFHVKVARGASTGERVAKAIAALEDWIAELGVKLPEAAHRMQAMFIKAGGGK